MQCAARVVRGGSASPISRFVVRAALLVGVLPFLGVAHAQDKPATQKSLYQRVGGYDAIAGIVDDFLKQLQADPAFQRFGQGRGQNSLMRARQLIVDQICALSGGPCIYIGREMKTAHHGLAITQVEWESAGKHMGAALQKFNVAEPDQKEFAAMIEKLRTDIVEPPKPPEPAPATKN
jgi:hemoglobin